MKCAQHPDFDLPCAFVGCSARKFDRIKWLQEHEWKDGKRALSEQQQAELDGLRREISITQREIADDKSTLFTDESRRPQLNGVDWNDANHQLACDEVGNFVKMLAARFGVPLAEAALQAGIAALKR